MEQVLKLDQDCEEAVNDLLYCKVQQLLVRTGLLIVVQLVEHNEQRLWVLVPENKEHAHTIYTFKCPKLLCTKSLQ